MKKFLAVFDGYRMSENTLDYAIQLAKLSEAHLVGVFLDDFLYRSFNTYQVIATHKNYEKLLNELTEKDENKRDAAAAHFEKECARSGIHYSIHRDKNIAIQDLKHESMFADLVIIDKKETFTKQQEEPPTRFMKELLADVQCPVLIVPSSFMTIDKIVLLYDGGPSSMYAIKMFSYLFDSLKKLPIEIFTVKPGEEEGTHLPDNKLMREFVKRHFAYATFTLRKGNVTEQIVEYLKDQQENKLAVMGAYQRSEFSRWFKESMADVLLKGLDMPLFIAHSK